MKFYLSIFCLLATLQLAHGGALGQIDAFIDGERHIWRTITLEQSGETISTARFHQSARMAELYLQAHPEPRFTTHDVISLEVRYLGQYSPKAEPMDVEILYMPNGMGGPFWTSRGAPLSATIDVIDFDIWGDVGKITVAFSGEICHRAKISAVPDPTNCKTVSGVAETELSAR